MENLEHTKKTAAEIEDKVTEAKKTSAEIDKVRIPTLTINQKISPGKGAVQILSSEGLRPLLHPQRSEQDQPHVPVLPQGVQRRVRRRHQGVWRSHNQLKILSNLLSVLSWTQTWPTELETSQTPSLSKCSSTQQGSGY